MTSQKTTWLGPIGNHKRQVKSATLGRSFWRHEREIRDHFMKSLEKVEKKFPLEVKMQSAPIGREIGLSVKSERIQFAPLFWHLSPPNRNQGLSK